MDANALEDDKDKASSGEDKADEESDEDEEDEEPSEAEAETDPEEDVPGGQGSALPAPAAAADQEDDVVLFDPATAKAGSPSNAKPASVKKVKKSSSNDLGDVRAASLPVAKVKKKDDKDVSPLVADPNSAKKKKKMSKEFQEEDESAAGSTRPASKKLKLSIHGY